MTVKIIDGMPIIKLQNGLLVGNFSSPHLFTFTTGEVLPRCFPERIAEVELVTTSEERLQRRVSGVSYATISLSSELTSRCKHYLYDSEIMRINGEIDIVLVTRPLMDFLHHRYGYNYIIQSPWRVAMQRENQATIFPDRFCI